MESLTELALLQARPLQSARYSSKTAQTVPRRHFLQPKCASLSGFSASAEANGPARNFRTGPFLLLRKLCGQGLLDLCVSYFPRFTPAAPLRRSCPAAAAAYMAQTG